MGAIVETAYGKIEGTERDGVPSFRGIPFAKPPVGELRWRPPRRVESWTTVRDATQFGRECPQISATYGMLSGAGERMQWPRSEDCLYLNVWTPAPDSQKRPVLVWIHGGALISGARSNPAYHGQRIVKRGDIVLVTINYRLGMLGLLGHRELTDDETGYFGNYGLHDQIAALQWVQENIEAFGGDSSNVTIFGESAGGLSVGTLLGVPSARGLFHRAIIESGGWQVINEDAATEKAQRFASAVGIDIKETEKLQEMPVEKILEAQADILGSGVRGRFERFLLDGNLVPKKPIETIAEGNTRGVPVISGTNRDEDKFFLRLRRNIRDASEADLVKEARRALARSIEREDELDRMASAVVDTYRRAREGRGESTDEFEILSAMRSDLIFRIPCAQVLDAHTSHTSDAYSYLFAWESKAFEGQLGACHGLEIPFVFGKVDRAQGFTGPVDDVDLALSQKIQDSWLAFARSGNPSHAGLDEWKKYDANRRATMVFNRESRVEEGPLDPERFAWPGSGGMAGLQRDSVGASRASGPPK